MPQLPGVEHRSAGVGGLTFHYAEAGDPAGPKGVLQHGWPQHWWMWRHLIGPLADAGHPVITPDLRGSGWSDKPKGDYRKDALMRDLLGLLDVLEIERVRWVGHEWGAYVGLLAALRPPERIERCVLLSVPHPWQKERSIGTVLSSFSYQLLLA